VEAGVPHGGTVLWLPSAFTGKGHLDIVDRWAELFSLITDETIRFEHFECNSCKDFLNELFERKPLSLQN
jgi:hypothetical protein